MIDATDLDQRLAEHLTRVARINREAWKQEASLPTGPTRTRGISFAVASLRQRAGVAIVHAGERLQGTPTGRAADPATV